LFGCQVNKSQKEVKTCFTAGSEALKAWYPDRRAGFLRPKRQTKLSLDNFGGAVKLVFTSYGLSTHLPNYTHCFVYRIKNLMDLTILVF